MKEKTNNWLPWLSALLIGIIIAALLTFISSSLSLSRTSAMLIPNSVPSNQLVWISTIESINEFSGENSQSHFYKGALVGITISIILMFVIIPFIYVKGTLQSEDKENPSPLWYVGSAFMLMITILPVIIGSLSIYRYQNVEERSVFSRTQDNMRLELMDVSFTAAEQILELDDISKLSGVSAEILGQLKSSEYQFMLVTNPADSSIAITISSEEIKDFKTTTTIKPYSEEIFTYNRSF
ncbi:MAG: hypothetical protein ABJR05_10965 [Balneola sp.]